MNKRTKSIINLAVGNPIQEDAFPITETKAKNPAAVALGRLGGLKGGKARAMKLSAKQRTQIAKKAAKARWGSNR